MKEWLFSQFEHFNVLSVLVIFIFVTFQSKKNTQKLLKEESQEMYNKFEEVKDEIRGCTRK
jgi:hypothetical protein